MTPPPPSAPGWHARTGAVLLALAILGTLVAGVAASGPLRALLGQAWGRMRPEPVLVVLPVQAFAIWLCAVALWRLGEGTRGQGQRASLATCFQSRLLRDAGNTMLLFCPGLGEAIGTRAMVLAGVRPRVAVSLRALDVLAETLGQLPYMAVALLVLARVWRRVGLPALGMPALPGWNGGWGWLMALVVGLGLLGLVARHLAQSFRHTRALRRLRAEGRLLWREAARRHRALPQAVGLHIVGWGLSGLQIWLAARLFGLPLGLGGAVAVESAASAVRVLLFFVPGGLVTQEAGIVGAGLAFGLAPAAALALALVLRLRDVFFGLALAWWPVLEWRAKKP